MLAPIVLFVYNRLDHTQGVIETLLKNTLAKESEFYIFSDAAKTSDWAKESLAFCYSKGILDSNTQKINPKECVTREEIASMLYNILNISNLL